MRLEDNQRQDLANNTLIVSKDLLNSVTGSKICCAYFALSAMLLSCIKADLQRLLSTKPAFTDLKWHMHLQGHCLSMQPQIPSSAPRQ